MKLIHSIKTILWNSDQRRLRTLWRLVGQIVILGAVVFVIGGAFGCLSLAVLTAPEGLSPDQLSDPGSLQRSIVANPLLLMLTNIGSGLTLVSSIWLAGRLLDRRLFADFGFHLDRDWWIDFGFGLGLGGFLMLIVFLAELAAGWLTVTGTFVTRDPEARFLPAILMPLAGFWAVGFYEELFSRGYHLRNLAEGLAWKVISPKAAILIATLLSSTVFGALHAYNPNATTRSTVNITFAGVMLATGYLLTGELAIPIALHITWNFFQANVFGFPVSGADFRSATLIGVEQGGPDLWTGGTFGPEGGLLGLGAMLLGTLLTIVWVRWRRGRASLDLSLTTPPKPVGETG